MVTNITQAITTLIVSPPALIVAGGVLASIVWKFFERIESVLSDETKSEIAAWLSEAETESKVASWPHTFQRQCDRVFGPDLMSWTGFRNSCLLSLAFLMIGIIVLYPNIQIGTARWLRTLSWVWLCGMVMNFVPDYICVVKTRWVLRLLARRSVIRASDAIFADAIGTAVISVTGMFVSTMILSRHNFASFRDEFYAIIPHFTFQNRSFLLWLVPAFATSVWLWLYVGAGDLIRWAHRLDVGLRWFNRRLDVRNKPLQSIGLFGGVFVAVLFWTLAAVSRLAR